MLLKDHYMILELEPSATVGEIKKAYRRLALQYHPDKNPGDPYAAAQFAEIKEAYEVLTNPAKKEYYLQQRWYDQSTGRRKKQVIITPAAVLKQALELEKYVSRLDHFRMDKQGLQDYILEMMNNDTISKLNGFGETNTNDSIITLLLDCLKPLPLSLVSPVLVQLLKLNTASASAEKIKSYGRALEKTQRGERYKIWIILLLVLLFCVFIIVQERIAGW